MIADRIKSLRENQNKTQSELAKQLGITRSSVNAWEMGISVPSTQYIVKYKNNIVSGFISNYSIFILQLSMQVIMHECIKLIIYL